MGKTKTAILTEAPKEEKSSEDAYREKKERQAAAAAKAEDSSAKATEGKEARTASVKSFSEPKKVHIAGLKGGQRIKIVEAATTEVAPELQSDKVTEDKKTETKEPKVRGLNYQSARAKISKEKLYSLPDAIALLKEIKYSKFEETLELHIIVKKTGISASLKLPHPFGKEKKIEVADEETLKNLAAGKIDFDVLLATADFMPRLVPFAKTLGPKGLMPNPKNGTLIKSAGDAKKFSGDTITLKTEKEAPLIHTVIGKLSSEDSKLVDNAKEVIDALGKDKQIIKIYMKSTMSPSVKITV